MSVAVIIPFYQKQPGFLRKAVESVLAQTIAQSTNIQIIVVDDCSPVSVQTEIGHLTGPSSRITLLFNDTNQGVSRSRNRGLDAIEFNTKSIAFLDSDDYWYPDYLSKAINEIDNGSDIFFANCIDSEKNSYFDYSDLEVYTGIAETKSMLNDNLVNEIVTRRFLPHLSFTVLKADLVKNIRFEESLHDAGEDHLFFIKICKAGSLVTIDQAVFGERTYGVSIYRSTLSWSSPAAYGRLIDQINGMRFIGALFVRGERGRGAAEATRSQLLDELIFLIARNHFRHFRAIMRALRRSDFAKREAIARLPAALYGIFTGRTRSRLVTRL